MESGGVRIESTGTPRGSSHVQPTPMINSQSVYDYEGGGDLCARRTVQANCGIYGPNDSIAVSIEEIDVLKSERVDEFTY